MENLEEVIGDCWAVMDALADGSVIEAELEAVSREKEWERRGMQYDIVSGFIVGLEEVRELSVDFNEKLFHRLVDYATVHSNLWVVFTFRNGVEVSTEI